MTPDQTKVIETMVRLEIGGGLPPGFELIEDGGVWSWISKGTQGQSQQRCGDNEPSARAAAWGRFYADQIGQLPPGYALAEEESPNQERHIWILADEKRRSFPKASREEAGGEAWTDFKAVIIGAKRPPHQEAGSDPRAVMARFQQIAFQLVGVHLQMEQIEKQERALIMQMRTLAGEFNATMGEEMKKRLAAMQEGPGGQGQG